MGFTFFFILGVLVAMIALFIALALHYRGKRIVTCPETHAPVSAEINAALAAGTWIVAQPRFVITACSRWPERADCDQACAPQIEASPDETLVRNIVANWYAERTCAYCATPIRETNFTAVAPALRSPDGTLREWNKVAPEELPQVLSSAAAVCARCELAEDFRRRFPERVIERPLTPLREHGVVPGHYVIEGPSEAVY